MTKEQFQQELKEKVKAGVKPSDLKKLKRSKSADDINPPNPPTQLLQDQLSEKQKEVESLRQQLETKPTLAELDHSLVARHKSLKDWFNQYSKNKELDQELAENIDQASEELITQDETISTLRTEINQLKLTNQSLQKDLNLATKLAEVRKTPLPENNSNYSNWLVYAFLALWFITLLSNSWNHNFKDNE
jgi:chromosome segregation ATPase